MSLSAPFIKRPVMTILLALSVGIFGVFSYLQLPVSDLPNVSYPVIQVTVNYPGANPNVMAANCASPLEQQFMQIDGLAMVTSSNTLGSSNIILQFTLDTNITAAATGVQAAIQRATGNLPQDLPSPPTYKEVNPSQKPIYYLGLASTSMTEGELYNYAFTSVAQRLNMVNGVSEVDVYGAAFAIAIQINPNKLYNLGLTFEDIVTAIQDGTNSLGAGELKGNTIRWTLDPNTQLDKAEQYNELIIAVKNGRPIYLKDIGEAIESISNEDFSMDFWTEGIPDDSVGIVLAIQKANGGNTVQIAKDIEAMLPEIREQIPAAIEIIPIYSQAVSIVASVDDVQVTLVIAFVLVCMVIFLFLGRARETIIPAIALPMSLLLTFVVMHLLGYSLDNLSLMALTLSIGFLVDDAVVFLENMVRRMEDYGESPTVAAMNGAKEISFTILSMTLSLAAVFMPLVFMAGLMGRMFRELGVTITVAIIVSGMVSLSLTPMMCARALTERKPGDKTRLEKMAAGLENWCLGWYGPSLSFFLKHRWVSAITWVLCMVGVVWFLKLVPKTFIPTGDSGFIQGVFVADTGASPKEMQEYQKEIHKIIKANPAVENFVSVSGVGSFVQSNFALVFIALKPENERKPIQEVNDELVAQMSQIPGIWPLIRPQPTLQISPGAISTNQGNYAYSLSGLDTDQIYKSSQQLVKAMQQSGLFATVSSDLFLNKPQLTMDLNRDLASAYGITATNYATLLKNAYSLNYNYLIKSPFLQYEVIVEAAPEFRTEGIDLETLYFSSQMNQSPLFVNDSMSSESGNNLVAFDTISDWEYGVGPLAVNHINNFSSVTLFYDTAPGVAIGDANQFVTEQANKLVPEQVIKQMQGQALIFEQTIKSMFVMAIVAIFVMYLILGILYESYIHPITVLSALPVAVVGGLFTLLLLGQDLSLYAMIGMFMLMGIVKKNGIMMIDFTIMLQDGGKSPREAVHEACLERFRPIMMTTIAALLGAVPIAIGLGADAESRKPLGSCIVGGLIVSQLITLYVTPALFLYFEAFQTKVMDRIPFFARGERTK